MIIARCYDCYFVGDVNEAVGILTNETPINSFGTLNDLTADIEMTDQTSSPIDLQNDRFPTTNFYELEQRGMFLEITLQMKF